MKIDMQLHEIESSPRSLCVCVCSQLIVARHRLHSDNNANRLEMKREIFIYIIVIIVEMLSIGLSQYKYSRISTVL